MTQVLRMCALRVALLVPQIIGVTLVVFLIAQLLPGDPATSALGIFASNEARHRFDVLNHLTDPVWVRYPRFLGSLLHGDLGTSIISGQSVRGVIAAAFPVTVQLAVLSMLFAAVIAVVAGVWSAVRRGSVVDTAVRVLSMGGLAIPSFWLGLMLVEFVALRLGWLPPGGYTPISDGFLPWLKAWALPAISLGLGIGASLARVVRASVLDELDKDYVRTGRGAGLSTFTIIRNVLRNALMTPLTVLGVRFAAVLGGAVVIEAIFNIPGMGLLLVQSVDNGDLEVLQALVIVETVLYILVNLVTDVAYFLLNPKIREA